MGSTSTPVYAVNSLREIVYLNSAICELTGVAAEEVMGRRCDYHNAAASDPAVQLVSDLCPPPETFDGRQMSATVVLTQADDATCRQKVVFLPLYDGDLGPDDHPLAVVAVCYPCDPDPGGQADGPATEALHRLVGEFRRGQRRRFHMAQMIGDSRAMQQARARIDLAIGSKASVLLVGPAGSGRRHAAQAIHYNGPSAEESTFVPLDGGLLGADLLRTTLMALDVRINSPQSDQCGTVLLRDVDRISGDVQTILADYLAKPKRNVRMIASSERPLRELVASGSYRDDLATALTTITIHLPSLKERSEDLPQLAQLFLERINAEGEKQVGGFSHEALDLLVEYDWPGNLEQLDRVVRETHGRAARPMIEVGDLPRKLHLAQEAAERPGVTDDPIDLDEILADVEKELMTRALRISRGNKAAAARLLGVSRPRLLRRIEQLGLGR